MAEQTTSKVYVQTDEQNRILRCEGGYTTPADLTGWVQIDEGTGDRYNLAQSHYFDPPLYTDDGLPRYKLVEGQTMERTEEEIAADRVPLQASAVRTQRDKLLAATDWAVLPDSPLDGTSQTALKAYRQALRDVPQQEGFPNSISWPNMPEITK